GEALYVGDGQPVVGVSFQLPGVDQSHPLAYRSHQGTGGEGADTHVVAVHPRVGEREPLTLETGSRDRLGSFGDGVVYSLHEGVGFGFLPHRLSDETDVVLHLVDGTLCGSGAHHEHGYELFDLLDDVLWKVGGRDHQVGIERHERVDARLAPETDVGDPLVEGCGADPGGVPLDIGDAHRHHTEADEVLDDTPFQTDDLGGGSIEGDLFAPGVGQGDRPGGGVRSFCCTGFGAGGRWTGVFHAATGGHGQGEHGRQDEESWSQGRILLGS